MCTIYSGKITTVKGNFHRLSRNLDMHIAAFAPALNAHNQIMLRERILSSLQNNAKSKSK